MNMKKNPLHCPHRDQARLNNILRHWIHFNHLPLPSKKILEQIVQSVIQAREDSMPVVRWKRDVFQCEIRKYRDKLYLLDVSMGDSQLVEDSQPVADSQPVEDSQSKEPLEKLAPKQLEEQKYSLSENVPLEIIH